MLAWHDITCPEAVDCRIRVLHARSALPPTIDALLAFLDRMDDLQRGQQLLEAASPELAGLLGGTQ